MLPQFISKEKIPHKPGIYIYKNSKGKVIYIGKAVDLFSRVSSYFSGPHDAKTTHLVNNIADIETIVVESELEALILEANLIKKYLPLYNIRLTDDKDYLYIGITKEDFPRVITARKPDLKSLKRYFGPFPSSKTVKQTLKQLRRVFPWCQSPPKKPVIPGSAATPESRLANQARVDSGQAGMTGGRPCFYYHLGLCPGACVGKISKEDYNKIINRFSRFLSGQKEELINELGQEMALYSKDQQYEEADRVKRIVEGVQYVTQTNRVTSYLENPNFLEDQNKIALEELQKVLNLPDYPSRIECYDISNFQGRDATGSLVVLTNGEIVKSQYRKFKIKITGKPDDFAMHNEMMTRRLKHKEWPYPQLFLIDGGRGQVRAAKAAISNFQLPISNELNNLAIEQLNNIPVFGLAKREEWLYPPEGEVVKLPKRSLALRLLQKIRDESHRFAITYHRKLRKRASGY